MPTMRQCASAPTGCGTPRCWATDHYDMIGALLDSMTNETLNAATAKATQVTKSLPHVSTEAIQRTYESPAPSLPSLFPRIEAAPATRGLPQKASPTKGTSPH